jgi:hypothetical protein
LVRNGTATIGGTAYSTAGTEVIRVYHSGAWTNYVDDPTFVDAIAGMLESPSDKTYKLVPNIPYGGTITEVTTVSVSGTCTATFKINTTALGGTANSVSSSEQSQTHSSSNTFVAGDDIQVTISSNSSCVDMSFRIKITRTI